MRRLVATEFLGTYFLIFACSGAVVVDNLTHSLTPVGMAGVSGLVVMTLIYALRHLSGAHFNPLVSLAFWLLGILPARLTLSYIVAQLLGGLAASATVWLLFGQVAHLGATIPIGPWHQTFCLEFLFTFWLLLVILGSSVHGQATKSFAGLAVGGMVALASLICGPLTGASLNPVRTLAPALLSGQGDALWIYMAAPSCGALAATLLYRYLYHGE
ncbi:MIP/aquaporin family protein [Tumebacillus permanentifrigoris]|uniref:MIP family channel proteins n=1 Tax=Tumebacillus permanentifrigoris TaxID=378543 RepID=A0A316DAR2_9BACL|nr:aquaporin [Tumebacillus permanentifrigoris]PWK14892.1 MIP family channel proteins [Tumebacillus permanentifrigoris]